MWIRPARNIRHQQLGARLKDDITTQVYSLSLNESPVGQPAATSKSSTIFDSEEALMHMETLFFAFDHDLPAKHGDSKQKHGHGIVIFGESGKPINPRKSGIVGQHRSRNVVGCKKTVMT